MPDRGTENQYSSTFDNQLIELESVDSTNNYAMGLIHEGLASDGMVCLARHQWAGKGQRGRQWLSEPGQNLMMSLVIKPSSLNLSHQFPFSAVVSLGILDLVRRFEAKNWSIKWPNDIYWNDRKAAGILIESVTQGGNWLWAVVGIGMNLNQLSFPVEIPNAVSLKQITSSVYKSAEVARELVSTIQNRMHMLRNDPDQIMHDFNRVLYKRNCPIPLKKANEIFISHLIGVDAMGFLITDQGKFASGEVEFMIRNPVL